jgi:hypothetical protein
MSTQRVERRRAVPRGAVTRVTLGHDEAPINANTRNLSLTGMCPRTATRSLPASRRAGAAIGVERRGARAPRRIPARMVRSHDHGAGVEFEQMTAAAPEALGEVIAQGEARRRGLRHRQWR